MTWLSTYFPKVGAFFSLDPTFLSFLPLVLQVQSDTRLNYWLTHSPLNLGMFICCTGPAFAPFCFTWSVDNCLGLQLTSCYS